MKDEAGFDIVATPTDAFVHAVDALSGNGVRLFRGELGTYRLFFELGRGVPVAVEHGIARSQPWQWVADRCMPSETLRAVSRGLDFEI